VERRRIRARLEAVFALTSVDELIEWSDPDIGTRQRGRLGCKHP
jgi:hypothetical protein